MNSIAVFDRSISAGALPVGMSISTGGLISGTPAASGLFGFTARVQDAAGGVATRVGYRLDKTASGLVTKTRIARKNQELLDRGHVRPGDELILTLGELSGVSGGTNTMKLLEVSA